MGFLDVADGGVGSGGRPIVVGTIGERIRALRGRTTQSQLAANADVSLDLIRKLEQGQRHTASIGSLHKIARALDVSTGDLLGKSAAMPSPEPDAGVVAIRHAITAVDDLLAEVDPDAGLDLVGLDDLNRSVIYGWGAYWAGRLDELSAVLAPALVRGRAAHRGAAEADRAVAADLMSQLYQITACSLVHLGQPDSAFLALREALKVAAGSDDGLRPATLRGSLAWLLLTQGRYGEAHKLATATAVDTEPDTNATAPQVAVHGSLLLTAATAVGRDGNASLAADLIGHAAEAAHRNGDVDRRDYETSFGPSQVAMQTVDVHVVTERFGAALAASKQMSTVNLPLAAQSRHRLDVAHAHTRLGHTDQAIDTLLATEAAAPVWFRHQVEPRFLIVELMRRQRRGSRLRRLADRLGVPA
jgi:transcriptional regulator with XRE-family HTH domain